MYSNQYLKISPDFDVLYVDAEGCCFDGFGDEIINDDVDLGPRFSFAVPGIEEWLRRYVDATDFVNTVTAPSFDWKTWHYEGLLFAKAIRKQLPKCYKLFYEPPYEDKSNTVSCIEIDEEIDSLIECLGKEACPKVFKPSFTSHVFYKIERRNNSVSILFQLNKMKKEVNFPFCNLPGARNWLEHIIEGKETTSSIELYECKLYFCRQTIGVYKGMGQFWILDSKMVHPEFTAYVNVREFVIGLYLSLMTELGFGLYEGVDNYPSGEKMRIIWGPYNEMKSNVIESYIAGHIPFSEHGTNIPVNETIVMFPDYGGCIFWDTMGVGVGDADEVCLETGNFKLDVPGLDKWSEFYDNHDDSLSFEEYWRVGWELAKKVRKQLPDNIDLYYMCYDPKQPERIIDYEYWLPKIIVPSE